MRTKKVDNKVDGKQKGKYWYKFTEYYCPLCNRTEVYKVRIYDKPKPKNYDNRHEVIEHWDGCGVL